MEKGNKRFRRVIGGIIALAFISMAFKVSSLKKDSERFLTDKSFKVNYKFYAKAKDKKLFVKSYIPSDNERQRIQMKKNKAKGMDFELLNEGDNKRAIWRAKKSNDFFSITYSFLFKGKAIKYELEDEISCKQEWPEEIEHYLISENNIEVKDPAIREKAFELYDEKKDLKQNINALFSFVHEMPSAPIRDLTTAKMALEQFQASCNGKSRLFVALCRSVGIPARLKGGLILEETKKRTSHLWTEVYIQNKWVPFDVLNGHFASLPAHYLEVHNGDRFLLTHTPDILFDYSYEIEKSTGIPLLNIDKESALSQSSFTLIPFLEERIISKEMLFLLILLPLTGLIIAICKNVIGLKTYGVFLPILIAHSFSVTGYFQGMFLLLLFSSVVALLTIPLSKWGILHTPKIVIVLSISIFLFIALIQISRTFGIVWLSGISFFPIVIMAILSERLARSVEEDGLSKASNLLGQTLLVTSLCFFIFNSVFIKSLLVVFPEIILLVIGITLMLGKWIGVRLSELNRFKTLINA